ncbi:MAG: glycosyltransferase family 9 protein [Bacteroidetes bacterium]|nr:glycosyltransferase family 9 protein [Bacteroidota bacterium]
MSKPQGIVIMQTGFVGDAVLASGLLRGLAASGCGRVGLVVRAEFAALFESHPGVHRLHLLAKGARGGNARLAAELREGGYDVALLPHRSARTALIAYRSGIHRRIGFSQSDARLLLTDRVQYEITMHETDRNAELAARAGVPIVPADRRMWLVPSPASVAAMRERFLRDGRPVVLLAPGSVWPTKRWGEERFAGLARRVAGKGKHVVVVGSSAEADVCGEVARGAGLEEIDVAAGTLSLADLVAIVSLAERLYTNDSAPLHIAEAVGTPVTAIFGPTVPEFGFGPLAPGSHVVQSRGLSCRPCCIHGGMRCPIGTHACMTMVSVEEVLAGTGLAMVDRV